MVSCAMCLGRRRNRKLFKKLSAEIGTTRRPPNCRKSFLIISPSQWNEVSIKDATPDYSHLAIPAIPAIPHNPLVVSFAVLFLMLLHISTACLYLNSGKTKFNMQLQYWLKFIQHFTEFIYRKHFSNLYFNFP